MQPCKRRVRSPPGSPPAQGRSPPEQAQSEKSQGVQGTESPDSSINTKENRELRVRFFGGTTIFDFIAQWNAEPTPFVWTAKAEDILAKVERCRQRLEEISPGCTKPKRRLKKAA